MIKAVQIQGFKKVPHSKYVTFSSFMLHHWAANTPLTSILPLIFSRLSSLWLYEFFVV